MDQTRAAIVARAITDAGLAGVSEPDLLHAFCRSLVSEGLPVARATVLIDTLHPVHEGRAFRWRRDQAVQEPILEYGRTSGGGQAAQNWQRSPFFHLVQSGEDLLRRNLAAGDPEDFPVVGDARTEGQTDFVAMIHRFAADGVIGEMDCVYSSWTTDAPGGFSDGEVAMLCALTPTLALAMKCASLARIAETLVETYLGRDAGRRVLNGRIARGVTDRIEAVLWFSDLRSFTHITETAAPDEIIPFLNDYAQAIISSVHEAGGDVLKLIGDGTLAIFKTGEPAQDCRCALLAERLMRSRISALNETRSGLGLPVTEAYLGLHIGEVFYGNIGSHERLDFTVVGPAVNEATRIAALCRSVEKDVLVSSAFAEAASGPDRVRLVSVGRFALKGIQRPRELFTLEPDTDGLSV
ncbi:MAG: adenylate/guanylate cyclase domain-containing protein [Microvirga sp.]